jgi:hypothetical protein
MIRRHPIRCVSPVRQSVPVRRVVFLWHAILTASSVATVLPAQAHPDLRMEAGQSSVKYTYWVVASKGYAYIFQSYNGGTPVYQRKTKL